MPEQYQHRPDQGPGGDKQLLLYVVLAFAMVLLFEGLFVRPKPKQDAGQSAQTAAQQSQAPAQAQAAAAVSAPAAAPAPVPARQAASEGAIVVENDLYRVALTNRGGVVKSWVLKKYKDESGKPLDLVNAEAAAKFGLPLSLWTYDESTRNQLNQALYVSSMEGCSDAHGAQAQETTATSMHCSSAHPVTITYEYAAQGIEAHKRLTFDNSYVAGVETSVTQNGKLLPAYPAWPAGFGDQVTAVNYASGKVDWQTPEGPTHTPAAERNIIRPSKWVSNGDTVRRIFNWVGISDQYFAAVFLPAEPAQTAAITLNQTLPIPKDRSDKNNQDTMPVQVLGVAAGNVNGPTSARLFVGPKDVDVLRSVYSNGADGAEGKGPSLSSVVDWGFFGVFAKWLFLWLNWTHDHWIANWGWAIIILTLIITLAFLPLRLSQMKTSLKMQKVQPLIQDLNKKYQKYGLRDTEKQQQKQQEMMAIYKEHGINPASMGGCLFMVVQLPLIWAFYELLGNTIELRHASWLWIHDLSAPDPLHILPVFCIITMIAMQYMTPMPGMDANQRRMMNIMMVGMFGWFTWAYSSGVAMYLTVSYMISVAQQYFLNRSELGREIKQIQAKRTRKKQGLGKQERRA